MIHLDDFSDLKAIAAILAVGGITVIGMLIWAVIYIVDALREIWDEINVNVNADHDRRFDD